MHRRQAKYRAIPTEVDGIRFASKKEAARYRDLMLLHRSGKISDLSIQQRYPLEVNGIEVAVYIADFTYSTGDRGQIQVVEDVKGMKTPLYRLKKKMFEAQYGMKITEV